MNAFKKVRPVHIIRRVCQLVAFILIPGVFTSTFMSIKAVYIALLNGKFNVTDYSSDIVLILVTLPITVLLGRFFCGFLCAFGSMGDLLWFISKKTIKPRFKVNKRVDAVMKLMKYVILVVIVIGIWTLNLFSVDSLVNPWNIFGMYSTISGWQTIQYLISIGGLLLLIIMIGSLFIERFFCRYFCPLGAIFALLSRFRVFHIRKNREHCGSCKMCSNKCSMGINLNQYDNVTSGECINCFQCESACMRKNVKTNATSILTIVASVAVIIGLFYADHIVSQADNNSNNAVEVAGITTTGKYIDGTYTGTGRGFRGETSVTVTVENGNISEIVVDSTGDDYKYFSRAENSVISDILDSQDTDVDVVSGATFSSNGIKEAVKDALKDAAISGTSENDYVQTDNNNDSENSGNFAEDNESSSTSDNDSTDNNNSTNDSDTSIDNSIASNNTSNGANTSDTTSNTNNEISSNTTENANSSSGNFSLADGTYSGTGTGFRGDTDVSVEVKDGTITDITVDSYQDDEPFFRAAEEGVISEIIESQDVDVDAVSGATFSSKGIMEAVADALDIVYANSNSSTAGSHGGRPRKH